MKNKKVLVTGASRGIGKAIAEKFFHEGYTVFGTYLNSEKEAEKLKSKGIAMIKTDMKSRSDIKKLHESIGDIDILVNNAGVSLRKVFQTVTADDEENLYGTNLFGVIDTTREFLQGMINNKDGCIINISSVFGEVGGSLEVDYSTSKAAIIGFTKALAKEVGPSQVRVNAITPGIIDTDMNKELTIEDVEALTDEIPLETLGRPENVAEAVYFLASDKAYYINGTVIRVDGGWM